MRTPLLAVALASFGSIAAAQQAAGPVIQLGGKHAPVPNANFEVPKDLDYKIAFDIEIGGKSAGEMNDEYNVPARLVNIGAALGLPRSRVQAVVVIHGAAGEEMLNNAEYRARKGVDNPNVGVLEEMAKAGVKIILCGQTMDTRKLPKEKLLPFIQVAPSAAWAHAVLLRQGFTLNPF